MMRSSLPFAGDDDGGNGLQFLAEPGQQVEPVHSGQFDVGDQHRGRKFGKARQSVFRAAHAQDFVAPPAQQGFVTDARVFFILDDQDAVGEQVSSFQNELHQPFGL